MIELIDRIRPILVRLRLGNGSPMKDVRVALELIRKAMDEHVKASSTDEQRQG